MKFERKLKIAYIQEIIVSNPGRHQFFHHSPHHHLDCFVRRRQPVYADMLSAKEKYAIEQTGEITRQIEFNDPARHCLLRGKLRILKTESPQTLNFVEVGEWVYHGHRSSSDQLDTHEFRDSLLYDEHGNTLSRRIYEKNGEQFQIKEQWTSELIDGRFLQHIKAYENGILVAEYTWNVVNYLEAKSDLQKDKIHFGIDKGYYNDGTLAYVKSYNNDGQLIAEKKYAH